MSNERKGPVTEMTEQLAGLEQEASKLRDEYVHALADFDNYRKRVERDLVVTQRIVLEGFVRDLMPVLDGFEHALAAAAADENGASIRKGVELIHRQLCEVLKRHGVTQFSCVGQEFDPRRAEAMGSVETDQHEPNTVVQEVCKGYECEGRVIRPSRVLVARAKPDPSAAGEVAEKAQDAQTRPAAE